MEKYHKIVSVAFALAFLILLQQFPAYRPLFRILALCVFVFLLFLTGYNYWYLQKISKFNKWVLFSPALFYLSGFLVYLVIPSDLFKGLFLISMAFLAALFEAFLGNYSENLFLIEHLIMGFGFISALSAFNFYFPGLYTLILVSLFAVIFVLTRSFYEFVPTSEKTKLVAAVCIGLFCSEFFWAANLLPFHFSLLALYLFNLFYLCLILNYYYLFQTLTLKKMTFHLVLIFICSAVALVATPWRILT